MSMLLPACWLGSGNVRGGINVTFHYTFSHSCSPYYHDYHDRIAFTTW